MDILLFLLFRGNIFLKGGVSLSELEPKVGNVADIFKFNTDNRIDISNLDPNIRAVYVVLQEEMFNALRILENSISK